MLDDASAPTAGGCSCQYVRYQLNRPPLFVHACHCTYCQRETGTAFALNGLIEADFVELLEGDLQRIDTPSASGRGQRIFRCPRCHVAIYSHYTYDTVNFIRMGTLDDHSNVRPDIHIYTSTKLPWLELGDRVPVMDEYYDAKAHWPADSLQRYRELLARTRGSP